MKDIFALKGMIAAFALTVLSVIYRLSEGKKLKAKCRELIERKSFVTGRLIKDKCRYHSSENSSNDKYIHDNLIQVVKGQAGFEKSTLEAVIQARGAATQAVNMPDTLKANDVLTGALHRLLAVAESYPTLQSNTGFSKLQSELSETESKVAYARQFYNDTVLKYNNAIQMFPASIIAGMCGFTEQAFLSITDKERENVKIGADDF